MKADIAMVRLEEVSKTYGAVRALEPTSLEVRRGEFLTLLGPSGSGKTTLLNLIAGTIRPDSGRIFLDGADMTRVPPSRRGLGMVFQHYALMPHMTVFENIAFPLRVRRVPRGEIARRVAEVLEMVHLPEAAKRKPAQLSGGQQQRIAIARCLVYEPSVILMDEPLGALDRKLREEMQLELKRLHRELGITALYVTHDQEEALTMSDRILLMRRGAVAQAGTPAELYNRPNSVFAAQFLGDSNILRGRVTAAGRTLTVATGVGELHAPAPEWPVAEGAAVALLVRPENVVLAPASDGEAMNTLAAEMISEISHGGTTKSFLRLADGLQFQTQALSRPGRAPAPPGAAMTLHWPVEETLVLPPEDGAT